MPVRRSLNLDHISVRLAERKLVSAHSNFDRVAERCNLADVNFDAFGNTHVHDATLDRTLAVKLYDFYGISDLCLPSGLHCLYPP